MANLLGVGWRVAQAATAVTSERLRGKRRGPDRWLTAVATKLLRGDLDTVVQSGTAALRRREFPMPWPLGLRRKITVENDEIGGVPGMWIAPKGWSEGPTLIYFHGGGYCFCSPATHRVLVAEIALAAGARCFSVDYRLAPEHPFPAAIEDALAVMRALREEGLASDDLVLGGDSAGGGLTMATLLALRDAGDTLPRAAVLISPWVDLTCSGESIDRYEKDDYLSRAVLEKMASLYLGEADAKNPAASPLFADLAGLPPLLIQVGGRETLLSESEKLAKRAREAGVEMELQVLEGAVHDTQTLAAVAPEARSAIGQIGAFVRG